MNEYLIIKKITDIDEDDLNIMTTWMYNWWGKREHYSFEEVKCFMLHSMQENRLPITYGMFLDNKIIGMYQFTYEDLSIRPDIYPWLANVYIDKDYRGKGYGRKLLESIKTTFQDITDFNEIYLYTKHIGLYEKFGWIFVSDFYTYSKNPRMQRLYKFTIVENKNE